MEFKTDLSEQCINDFVNLHPNCHYGKTSMWANVKKFQENYTPVFTGLYDHNQLVATATLLIKAKWGIKYAYIPWGICTDYNQKEILHEYTQALKEFGKKKHLAFIKMDPNVRRFNEDGSNNEEITQALIQFGFKHKGYGYGYDGSWSNRFTLMIDISPSFEEIKKNFTSSRKSAIKKHNVYSIHTELADLNQISTLCDLEAILGQEKGFKPHSKAFFENIMNSFPQNHVYAISTLNIEESITQLENEIQSKKYAKDPEAKAAKEKSRDELLELEKRYGKTVAIAAGLFLFEGKMSWDLYLYKRSEFNFINGTDEVHQFMIQEMKKHGVELYDMCGFSGNTDPSDPYYGLYLYKSSFGSKIVEHIGEFNLILNPKATLRFNRIDRLYRKVRRKLNYLKNHKG